MAQIKILKDNDKNTVYPQSVTQAIVDANGVNLDTILHNTVMTDAEEDVADIIVGYEDINNKVNEINEESTDLQYPSAKAVHDFVVNDLSNYYDKTAADGKFTSKEKYSDTAVNIGRKASTTVGEGSIAFGKQSTASGTGSLAGGYCTANGSYTAALGVDSVSGAYGSIAAGQAVTANAVGQAALGSYNVTDTSQMLIVGNGSGEARSNAFTVAKNGSAWAQGPIYVGSNSGTNKDEGSKKLAAFTSGTEDLEAGVSELATDTFYIMYE